MSTNHRAGIVECADAVLISLCERLVAWEARYDEIYTTIEDDDEADRAEAAIGDEYEEIRDRLYKLDAPVTPEGQRAYARACLATAGRDSAAKIMLDQGGNLASFLAFGLAHSIAESGAGMSAITDDTLIGDFE